MIIRETKNVGIDKIDVYYEDVNLDYFEIADLTPYFSIGKNSFLVDVVSNAFVEDGSFKIELKDADDNDIYIDYPEYREGEMRRISVWIYPNNANGTGLLTIVGELKDVPREWTGVYNVRYSIPILINKDLPNTQPIRFYDTPSASVGEYRKFYLDRTWDTTETTIVTGSNMSTLTTDGGDYLLSIPNRGFDYKYNNAIINIQGKDPIQIKEVVNNNLVKLNIPYTYSSSYENLLNVSYSIEYNNEPTYSATENYQSYAEITVNNIDTLSGEVKKIKTYLKSKGAFDQTEYTFVNETEIKDLELLSDSEETSSVDIQMPKFYFSSSIEHTTFTGSIGGDVNDRVYFDWDGDNTSVFLLQGTSSENLQQIEHELTTSLVSHSVNIYKWDNIKYLDFSNQIGLTGSIDNFNFLSNLEELYLQSTSLNININIINNFPNLNTCNFYSSSINSYTSDAMLDFSVNNNFYMNVSNVELNSESIDQFLMDLANVPQTGSGSLVIDGTNDARTMNSDVAVATLTSTLWTINYNEDRVPWEIKAYLIDNEGNFTASFKGDIDEHIFVNWNDDYLKFNSKEVYNFESTYIPILHQWSGSSISPVLTQSFFIYNNFTHFSWSYDDKVTFDLNTLPSSLEYLRISGGLVEIDGDLDKISSSSYVEILGNNLSGKYNPTTVWENMSYFNYNPSESCGLSQITVDNLIIDINNSNSIESGTLWLAGSNATRSLDSEWAKQKLIEKGWEVTFNEEIPTWDFWISGSLGESFTASFGGIDETSMSIYWDDNSDVDTYFLYSSEYTVISHSWNSGSNHHVLIYGFGIDIPEELDSLYLSGSLINITDWDLMDFVSMSRLEILDYEFAVTYTDRAEWISMSYFRFEPSSSDVGLSTNTVDNLINDINSSSINDGTLWLSGYNQSRSMESTEASKSLITKGWELTMNEPAPSGQLEYKAIPHNYITMSLKNEGTPESKFYVDWGDGSDIDTYNFSEGNYVEATHEWAEADTKTISIYESFTHFSMSSNEEFTLDLANLPNELTSLYISGGLSEVTGDLINAVSMSEFVILGNTVDLSYTRPSVWDWYELHSWVNYPRWINLTNFQYMPGSLDAGITKTISTDLIMDIESNGLNDGILWLAGNNGVLVYKDVIGNISNLINRGWAINVNF